MKEEALQTPTDLIILDDPKELNERSLVNLCFDLVELDLDAPENQEIMVKTFNALGVKVDSYVAVNQFAESQIERFKNEIEFLTRQKKKFETLQENLKNRALFALQTLDKKEIKSQTGHKISWTKYESVMIDDISLLPDWAVKKTTTLTANKTQIKEALKANQKVDGAHLEVNTYAMIK